MNILRLARDCARHYNQFMNAKRRTKLLNIISHELRLLLGEKLDRVILYGSFARGEAHADSDIDILIVVHGTFDYGALIHQTSELVARLSLEYDVVISRAFISKERFENEQSPFTLNVQREGVPI